MANPFNFGGGVNSVPAQPAQDWQLQSQGLNRKRALMDALMAQNMAPTPIQQVSGRVVNNGLLDGFSKVAMALALKGGYDQADKAQADIQRRQLAAQNAAFGEFAGAKASNPMDFLRNAQAVAAKHGIGIGELLSNPAVASQLKVMEDRAKGEKLGKGDQWVDGDGNVIAKGAPDLMSVAPGGTVLDPNNPASPLFKAPDKPLVVESGAGTAANGDPMVTHMLVDPGSKKASPVEGLQPVQKGPLAKATASATNAGEMAFAKGMGELDSKELNDLRANAKSAQGSLQVVQNLRSAISQGVYSGGGANAKTAAASIIAGLTGRTPQGLPGSEQFNAEASKLVLEHIKSLGANPSNTDRTFIEKTVPQLWQSPQARDALINLVEQRARQQIDLYSKANAYARQNNGLGGFPLYETAPPQQPQSSLPSPSGNGGWSYGGVQK